MAGQCYVVRTPILSLKYKAVILAGGRSERMGQDKAHLKIKGRSLAKIVFTHLSSQCSDILISGKEDYGLGVPIIPDIAGPNISSTDTSSAEIIIAPKGPVGGLYSVWQALRETDLDGFITVPIDGPNLPPNFCDIMVGQQSAISATSGGLHPTFAYWRLIDLSKAFKSRDVKSSPSLKAIAKLCQAREVVWPNASHFYNINTPLDLENWKISQDGTQY